ncbi:MAG: hypothetical protein MRQ09_06215 [Candidatus Midichloria sp.]|nr:hypothetical protein [Candidatus Midichloria sp.]
MVKYQADTLDSNNNPDGGPGGVSSTGYGSSAYEKGDGNVNIQIFHL